MSETNRLGINITATDTASATIRQLAAQAKALEAEIARANAAGIDQSGAYAAALRKPLAEITNQIAAIREQEAAIKRATAAIKEQETAASAANKTLREVIDSSFGIEADRAIKSATESAKVLATSLSAAAEADARLRAEALQAAAALETQGNAIRTLSGEQFFGLFNRMQGFGQEFLSAAESASVFRIELGELGSAVTTISSAGFNKLTADLIGVKENYLSAADSAAVFEKTLGEVGTAVQTTSAAGFSRIVSDLANVKTSYLSAEESANVFQTKLGELGSAVNTISSSGFSKLVSDLVGVKNNFLSAQESATVFQRELGELGSAVKTISASGFSRLVNDLIGVKTQFLSATESAAVFQRELGELGTAVQTISSSGFNKLVSDLIGVKTEFLSAADSAAVFERELGELGTAIQTISSAGFSKMVADLADVKMSYLSAAESAKVFMAAGVSEREMALLAATGITGEETQNGNRSNKTSSMPELRHSVALFDEMSRGQRGAMFGTIGAMFRDAGVSATTLATSIAGLMTVMAGQAILRGAENMGKWAEETRAAASAAGMGIEQYSALQGALSLVGVKAEAANASLRHVAESLNQALADPAARSAEAFHNLGISQEELNTTGGNIGKLLPFLADAFARTADGAGKTAAMEQIAGRGFENLIPALQGGSRELKALEEKAQDAGLTLTDLSANTLVKTGEKVKELSLEIGGSAKKAFEEWAPVIDSVVTSLGHLIISATTALGAVGKLTVGLGKSLGNQVSDETESGFQPSMYGDIIPVMPSAKRVGTGPGRAPSGPPIQPPAQVPLLTTPVSALEQMRQDMTTAAFSASQSGGNRSDLIQKETQAEIDAMQNTLATAKLTDNERVQISNELNQKRTQLANQTASAETVAAKQSYQDFVSNERLKLTEAANNGTKIIAVYNEWLSAAETRFKQSAATITDIEREKVQTINHLRLQEIKDSSEQEQRNNRTTVVMGQAQAIAGGTMGYAGERGSTRPPGEGTAALADQAQAIEAAMQKQVAQLTQAMNIAEKGSSDQRAAAQEIQSVVTNAKTEEIALYNKAAEASIEAANKTAASFNKFFDILGNSFQTFTDTVLRALIAPQTELIKQGLTTIKKPMEGNEIRQAGSKALLGVVTDFAQSLQNTLTQTLAKSLSGGATSSLTTLLSSKLMSLLNIGTTAATQAPQAAAFGLSATALTTAGTALTSAGAVLDTGAITLSAAATTLMTAASAMAVSSGGGGISGIMQFLPELAEFSSGGIVPSAAGGMVVGGLGATLAILHQKEMVLPAHLSTGIQQMVNRGGDTSNRSEANLNYSPTINTASRSRNGTGMTRGEFAQMMALHSGAMLGEARNMMRSGWRPA